MNYLYDLNGLSSCSYDNSVIFSIFLLATINATMNFPLFSTFPWIIIILLHFNNLKDSITQI